MSDEFDDFFNERSGYIAFVNGATAARQRLDLQALQLRQSHLLAEFTQLQSAALDENRKRTAIEEIRLELERSRFAIQEAESRAQTEKAAQIKESRKLLVKIRGSLFEIRKALSKTDENRLRMALVGLHLKALLTADIFEDLHDLEALAQVERDYAETVATIFGQEDPRAEFDSACDALDLMHEQITVFVVQKTELISDLSKSLSACDASILAQCGERLAEISRAIDAVVDQEHMIVALRLFRARELLPTVRQYASIAKGWDAEHFNRVSECALFLEKTGDYYCEFAAKLSAAEAQICAAKISHSNQPEIVREAALAERKGDLWAAVRILDRADARFTDTGMTEKMAALSGLLQLT